LRENYERLFNAVHASPFGWIRTRKSPGLTVFSVENARCRPTATGMIRD
jgi:hypothetical protein